MKKSFKEWLFNFLEPKQEERKYMKIKFVIYFILFVGIIIIVNVLNNNV